MMLPLPKKHQTIAEDKNKRVFIVKEKHPLLFFLAFWCVLGFYVPQSLPTLRSGFELIISLAAPIYFN